MLVGCRMQKCLCSACPLAARGGGKTARGSGVSGQMTGKTSGVIVFDEAVATDI